MAQTLVFGIVDTGADVVVVPETLATNLELPVIGRTCVVGATGRSVTANVFAVTVELMGNAWIVEAIALGDEALWGRNLVNRFRLTLDGHHLQLQVPR
jgi:predicted aspartyl protease